MSRVVFVEVLDRRGRPRSRHRFSSFPISIGRAYTNDLIVDDRYVSPEHLRVVETADGRLLAQDLESLNGLYIFGRSVREVQVPLRSGLRLRIGETQLRFVEGDEPVPAAQPMAGAPGGLAGRVGSRTASLLAIAFSFGVFAFDGYLEHYEELDWLELLPPLVGVLVGLVIWSGVWSFATRLLTHRFDFLRHLSHLCLLLVVLIVLRPVAEYVQFFSPSDTLATAFGFVAYGVWLIALLTGHLAIIGSLSPRRRLGWAAGVVGGIIVVALLFQHVERAQFSTDVPASVPLKALGASWLPTQSMEDFLAQSHKVKERVDTLANEK